jgi:GntR family transcriptional regulator / MocR family aminotransferase
MSSIGKIRFTSIHKAPLYRQLYEHLRGVILANQLKGGTKLPSTRALADELGVSRNTVMNAYNQLFAEGYLESREGSGTYVAKALPEDFVPTPLHPSTTPAAPLAPTPNISEFGARILQQTAMPILPRETAAMPFRAGLPALDMFPYELWTKLLSRYARRLNPTAMVYQEAAGYRPLREAIADHVTVTRRVRCTPDQILIVAGAQSAFSLAARLLLNPGDAAWVEDPGYLMVRGILVGNGAQIVPVPVDEDGLRVEIGIENAPNARLVYITPSHQFPLGSTLSLARRLALLNWAQRADAYILEDDYDSEYRFAGRPLASLQGLDEQGRVIYVGTFSKVMFPALRLGYMIVPPALVDVFQRARRFMDLHPPVLEQMALAEFITAGHFARHLRRMRTLYAERRAVLVDALQDLPFELTTSGAGMHLVAWLPNDVDAPQFIRAAAARGVFTLPIHFLSINPLPRAGILLGYAGFDERLIRNGVAQFKAALETLKE